MNTIAMAQITSQYTVCLVKRSVKNGVSAVVRRNEAMRGARFFDVDFFRGVVFFVAMLGLYYSRQLSGIVLVLSGGPGYNHGSGNEKNKQETSFKLHS